MCGGDVGWLSEFCKQVYLLGLVEVLVMLVVKDCWPPGSQLCLRGGWVQLVMSESSVNVYLTA